MINISQIVSDFDDYTKNNTISDNYYKDVQKNDENRLKNSYICESIQNEFVKDCDRDIRYGNSEQNGKLPDSKHIQVLEDRIKDLEDVIDHLNSELRVARTKIFSKTNLEKHESNNDKPERKLKCSEILEKEYPKENYSQYNNSSRENIEFMQNNIKNLEEMNLILKNELRNTINKNENFTENNFNQQDKIIQKNLCQQKRITNLIQDRNLLNSKIDELKVTIVKLNSTVKERDKEIFHLQNQCNSFSNRNEDLKACGDKLMIQNKKLQADLRLNEEELKELKSYEQQLINKNNEIKSTLEERVQKLKEFHDKERLELKNKIENLTMKQEMIESKSIHRLRKEKNQTEEHYQMEMEIIKEQMKIKLEKANEEKYKLNEKWRERFDTYRTDMLLYVQDLESKMEKTRDFNINNLKDVTEQRDNLQNKITDLENKEKEKETTYKTKAERLKRENEILSNRLAATFEENRKLNGSLHEKELALEDLEETVRRECEERDRLLNQIQEKIEVEPKKPLPNIFEHDLISFLPPQERNSPVTRNSISPISSTIKAKLSMHNSSPEIKIRHSEFIFNVNPNKRKSKHKIKPKKIENKIWK